MRLDYNELASLSLLDDLRSDRGMSWVPTKAWLMKVAIDSAAEGLSYDLAIDASGAGAPSRVDAGLDMPGAPTSGQGIDLGRLLMAALFSLMGVAGIHLMTRYRPTEALR